MTAFYLALLAVLLSGFGARDQVTLAAHVQAGGSRLFLLALAIVSSVATAALAAWLATFLLTMLGPDARLFMACFALIFAGFESMIVAPGIERAMRTVAAGRAAIVIAASQVTDAARFLVFAIAVATGFPAGAAIGGAIGGILLVLLAWIAPELVGTPRIRILRRAIGLLLLLVAVVTGMVAAGLL